jgi:hypothetical protein
MFRQADEYGTAIPEVMLFRLDTRSPDVKYITSGAGYAEPLLKLIIPPSMQNFSRKETLGCKASLHCCQCHNRALWLYFPCAPCLNFRSGSLKKWIFRCMSLFELIDKYQFEQYITWQQGHASFRLPPALLFQRLSEL